MGVQGPPAGGPASPPSTQAPGQQSTTPVATPPNPTAPNATTTTTAPQGPGQPATTPTATPPSTAPQLSVPNPDNNPKGHGKGAPPPTPRPAPTGPPIGQLPQGAPPAVQPPAQIPTIPPYDVTGQNQFSTGDTYIEPSTLYGTSPPSMQGLAFQQATTGDNAVPYEVYNYLQAFDTVANMISSGKVNG